MADWDVVVARYTEDVSWLLPIAARVHLYDKGATPPAAGLVEKFASYSRLPNVGREGDTYLHHILRTYDDPDASPQRVTVFVQGRIDDHVMGDPLLFVMSLAQQAALRGASVPQHTVLAEYQFRHTTYFGKRLQESDACFGEWFEKYVDPQFPSPGQCLLFYKNGLMAVKRSRVLGRDRRYYELLRESLASEDPETGHYLERSWAHVFRNDASGCAATGTGG